MKTICICNLKGGVGKTITTANFAAILAAQYHKRVLLLDADGQGNLSQFFGAEPDGHTTLELLQTGAGYYPDFVTPTATPGLDIIPADMSLMFADVDAFATGKANLLAIADLRDAVEEDGADGYDYLLIDCPPAFSAASTAALAAADDVIIPIKLDAFSAAGMVTLVQQLANMRRINERIHIAGCLITMWMPTEAMIDAAAFLRAAGIFPIFDQKIRRSPKVDDSTYARQALTVFSPRSAAAQDYLKFVAEYLEGEAANHGEKDV
ncbi:MAG: ParA family protein [Oscillospiraceae bacterium]